MRPAERDVMLFLLAVAAGSADGWSYVGLGHAFVANMTGNTVFLGLAVFKLHGDFLHPLISLAFYLVGTAVASYAARKSGAGRHLAASDLPDAAGGSPGARRGRNRLDRAPGG